MTLNVRYNSTTQVLVGAREFARQADALEKANDKSPQHVHRALVVSSTLKSAAALESEVLSIFGGMG